MPEKPFTVFGYVRVSTDQQLDNYSIEEQTQRIKAFCSAKGWTLLKVYTDGAYSGGTIQRPALTQMLQAIKQSHVDAVVVYKLDRLSRSQKDTLSIIEDHLLVNGTDFISLNENFDTSSPFGRAMIGILSVFAQLEKDQITERFTMGRIGRCKAGYYHGGANPPTGYDYRDGLLQVNQYEAVQVQKIFRLFLEGKSINAIDKQLRREYTTSWSASKVHGILKNTVYIGKVHFRGQDYDGLHQPLISKETFQEANRILNSFERHSTFSCSQRNPFRAGYLLSGLVVCSRCGARYSANHGYYKCYSRAKSSQKFVRDPDCKNTNWLIGELDALVIAQVEELFTNNVLLDSVLSKTQQPQEPSIDRKALEKRCKEIDSQTEKLIELYQLDTVPMELLSKRLDALTREKESLMAQLSQQDLPSAASRFLASMQEYAAGFYQGDLPQRRALLSSLIASINIDGDKVSFSWRL